MRRARTLAAGFGRLPAAAVVGGAFVTFLVGAQLLPQNAAVGLGLALPLVVFGYSVLREPHREWVFALSMAPAVVAKSFAELGASAWLGWLLAIPVVITLAVWDIVDRRRPASKPL